LIPSPADLRDREFKRILLIKLSAVGDIVHTLPVLHQLRRRYPDARIDWLVTPANAELIRSHPAISNIVEFPRIRLSALWRRSALAGYGRLAAALRRTGYDLAVDLHGQLRSGLAALATGAPVRIGFDRPRAEVWDATPRRFTAEARKHAWHGAREGSWLAYTHHIPVPSLDVHAVDRYLRLGDMLGFDHAPPDFSFPIAAQARERTAALLRTHNVGGRFVAIAPGTMWETKHWGSANFAAVAQHFHARGYAVVLTGAPNERAVCAQVAALAAGAVNLCGETSLAELVSLIDQAAMMVSNDSGPMHLAVARGRPVVAIFGPTDPVWIGPYRREGAALRAPLACSPCLIRRLRNCPHDHDCMAKVAASTVIARAEELLAGRQPAWPP
jgi:predicted lipopolysaccharide heptosyltransferase III